MSQAAGTGGATRRQPTGLRRELRLARPLQRDRGIADLHRAIPTEARCVLSRDETGEGEAKRGLTV
jgi:hypothetical protein